MPWAGPNVLLVGDTNVTPRGWRGRDTPTLMDTIVSGEEEGASPLKRIGLPDPTYFGIGVGGRILDTQVDHWYAGPGLLDRLEVGEVTVGVDGRTRGTGNGHNALTVGILVLARAAPAGRTTRNLSVLSRRDCDGALANLQ